VLPVDNLKIMRDVSDGFLLNMAEVSASLIGLFLVGVFFYVETSFRWSSAASDVVEPYFRASTRIVSILYSIPLVLPLTLVILAPLWTRILLVVLSLGLVVANLDTAARIRAVARVTGSTALLVNEIAGSVAVVVIVTEPWILGGFHPLREDLTWAILLSFATGFASICALVLSAFDIAKVEIAGGTRDESQ
jgi:hypothetical protein